MVALDGRLYRRADLAVFDDDPYFFARHEVAEVVAAAYAVYSYPSVAIDWSNSGIGDKDCSSLL